VTKILVPAQSNVDTSMTADNIHSADAFCRWATPEVCGACAVTDGDRVQSLAAGRHSVSTVSAVAALGLETCFSYKELVQGGCVDRRTFCYVADNRAYTTCKQVSVRVNHLGHRYRHGVTGGKSTTRATVSGNIDDDQQLSRQDVTATCEPRRAALQTRSSNDDSDQLALSALRCNNDSSRSSRASRVNDTTSSCGDVQRCANDLTTQQDLQPPLVKTWLYHFMAPPVMTSQSGDGDAAAAGTRPLMTSSWRRGRHSDESHLTSVVSRKQRAGPRGLGAGMCEDSETTASARRDADRIQHSDRSPSRRCSQDFTDTCVLQRVRQRAEELDSDIDDDATTSSTDDDDNYAAPHSHFTHAAAAAAAADDDDDDDDDVKSTLNPFRCKLPELRSNAARKQPQLSLTGRVIDIHRRHQQSCNS